MTSFPRIPTSPAELVRYQKPQQKVLLYAANFFEATAQHGETLAEYARQLHYGFKLITERND